LPFLSFFIESCTKLTVLKLDNCQYIDSSILRTICHHCKNLTSLSLSSCTNIATAEESFPNKPLDAFEHIKELAKLTRLNLYRTAIGTESAVAIVRACTALRSLNLGSCVYISDFDRLIDELADHNPLIESLDLWRAYSLTNYGVSRLAASCPKLEELDIGWW
jgi:Leucine-rich repeat (LRR) protein